MRFIVPVARRPGGGSKTYSRPFQDRELRLNKICGLASSQKPVDVARQWL